MLVQAEIVRRAVALLLHVVGRVLRSAPAARRNVAMREVVRGDGERIKGGLRGRLSSVRDLVGHVHPLDAREALRKGPLVKFQPSRFGIQPTQYCRSMHTLTRAGGRREQSIGAQIRARAFGGERDLVVEGSRRRRVDRRRLMSSRWPCMAAALALAGMHVAVPGRSCELDKAVGALVAHLVDSAADRQADAIVADQRDDVAFVV